MDILFLQYYPLGRSSLIAFSFVLSIMCPFRKDLLRLVVFFVSMWLAFDFEYVNLPEPVFLKRFAAARFVFILGINFSLTLNDFAKNTLSAVFYKIIIISDFSFSSNIKK